MAYTVPCVISVYFGLPGSGKTTFASWLVKQDLKHHKKVWSNVPILGAYQLDPKKDIGFYNISGGRLIIDEASIEYNNRKFKDLSQESIKWFKLHRHYQTAVDVFSQSYDDMDITLRRLAQNLYVIKKSIFPFFIVRRKIAKRIGIDDISKQIIDEYYFYPFSRKWIFAPSVWKLFSTTDAPDLPAKEFKVWTSPDSYPTKQT